MYFMKKINKKIDNWKGALLLEALLAVVIISVSLTLIVQSLLSSLRAAVYTSGYTEAVFLLDNKMFELIQKGFVDATLEEEGRFQEPYEAYAYRVDINNIDDNDSIENLNEVLVEVTWERGGQKRGLSAVTYLSKKE